MEVCRNCGGEIRGDVCETCGDRTEIADGQYIKTKKYIIILILISFFLIIYLSNFTPVLLLGNYKGIVVDERNNKGVDGAEVRVEWISNNFGFADSYSKIIAEYVTLTDSKGNYDIPFQLKFISPLGDFEGTVFEVKKEGYKDAEIRFLKGISGHGYNRKKDLRIKLNCN